MNAIYGYIVAALLVAAAIAGLRQCPAIEFDLHHARQLGDVAVFTGPVHALIATVVQDEQIRRPQSADGARRRGAPKR